MPNLWDDPGFEGNLAPTSVGTPATSERSNTQAHSGTYAWKVVTDAAGEGVKQTLTTVSGTFYKVTAWVYVTTSGVVTMAGPTAQAGTAMSKATTAVNVWQRLVGVFRATAATTDLQFTSGSGVTWYLDDVDVGALSAVTLTITPASLANSTETTGLRVDGADIAFQTDTDGLLGATSGTVRWKFTPRHGSDKWRLYGGYPTLIDLTLNGNNLIYVMGIAANQARISAKINSSTAENGSIGDPGFIAGTTYECELSYTPTSIVFLVDGVEISRLDTNVAFGGPLSTVYWGGLGLAFGYTADATFAPPA